MLAVPLAGVYPQQLQICVAVANWFEQKCWVSVQAVIAAHAVALWLLVNRGRHHGFVINVAGVVGCSFGLEFARPGTQLSSATAIGVTASGPWLSIVDGLEWVVRARWVAESRGPLRSGKPSLPPERQLRDADLTVGSVRWPVLSGQLLPLAAGRYRDVQSAPNPSGTSVVRGRVVANPQLLHLLPQRLAADAEQLGCFHDAAAGSIERAPDVPTFCVFDHRMQWNERSVWVICPRERQWLGRRLTARRCG